MFTPIQAGTAACILDGMTDPQIGLAMGCSTRTAEGRVRCLRAVMEAYNRRHLARLLLGVL